MGKNKLNPKDFVITKTETLLKTEKIQIDRCDVRLPNGNIVKWDVDALPDFFFGIPVIENQVLMTKEWRLGPNTLITQFTGSRCKSDNKDMNLNELKRELKEELGIEGGNYIKLISFPNGNRATGFKSYFLITDFKQSKTNRDENEIQEFIKIPVKGLFEELKNKHTVTGDTLLLAKLLEEKLLKEFN